MATSQSESQSEVLRDPVTAKLLDQLREELGKETEKTIFTCGGTIPITKSGQAFASDKKQIFSTSEPVTIRWDPATPETPASQAKLVLPIVPNSQANVEKLINDLEPASFGYHGKDVFDETYRKALKMDTNRFASTFNPYECGIIDGIAQVLLPSTPESDLRRGVRAELYKLNVYSSPSGKFKPHIDTPRGSTQFGSLVVCLPLEHEGGQLQVRHKGREVTYDWGSHQDKISWAAFYSDCEHEVLEVKSGYRLTLTYNLYAVRGGGMLTGVEPPVLDATQLPIYVPLKSIAQNKEFMPEVILPDMLKGLDMVIWETFGRLGFEASVKPVLSLENFYEDEDPMIIGNNRALHMSGMMRIEDYHEMDEQIEEWRGGETLNFKQVHWLTKPNHKQLQLAYIAVSI
ncbi:hypothetical protein SLS63_013793 [Diaporthe eres]|uniref:Fe2OG dioxygenase domain-containing protein n=1 Tax=Diaporthe eres TaxID=83184 RepID=A0ABR1NMJ2_DIAER